MAKYDPDRIAETADPFAPGTTGIEPLCDEFGRLIAAPTGGGGGGDASLAEQQIQTGHLSTIATAADVPLSDVVAAVDLLGGGATLDQIVDALTGDAVAQGLIKDELLAQGLSLDTVVTSLADIDANTDGIEAKLDSIITNTGRVPAQGQALAAGSLPVVLPLSQAAGPLATSAKQPAFGTAGTPSADVQSMQGVAGGTPIPSSNAAATQADGHSATIGATADADTGSTLVALLKWIKARLPTALVSGRFDGNVGAWLGSTSPTIGQKVIGLSLPVVIASDQTAVAVKGAGVSAPSTSVSTVCASNTRPSNGAPTSLVAATLFATGPTKLNKLELRYPGVGTRYVWVFDKATNSVTATDSAHLPIPITNAQGLVIVDLSTVPLNLNAGLVVSLSSTEFTYTLETSGFYARPTWQ